MLPNVDGLSPLRAWLLASSSAGRVQAGGGGSHLTVGKYDLSLDELRARMADACSHVWPRCIALGDTFIHALECVDRGAPADAVDDLIRGGQVEEDDGRFAPAREWYAAGLRLACGLRDRKPESIASLALARLCLRIGDLEAAGVVCRRVLELAEADGSAEAEIASCEGLAEICGVRGSPRDALTWYTRALGRAEATQDEMRASRLLLSIGKLWHASGNLDLASDDLCRARSRFHALGAVEDVVRTLCVLGEVERDRGRPEESAAAYREALAWSYRAPEGSGLEIEVHFGMGRLFLQTARWSDAEARVRQAERLAIASGSFDWLVRIYTLLGTLSGLREDDGGFVFFEQALQFSRMIQLPSVAQARVYAAYGDYKRRTKQSSEARAYHERARTLLTIAGATGEVAALDERLRITNDA